jgi:rod shape-determining protein MreD
VRFLDVALALLVAFIVQTVFGLYFPFLNSYLDLFTVLVAMFGLLRGRATGLVTGTIAGLIQDTFSGGLLGFNGIAKTTVGYMAGIAGRHFIVRSRTSRFLFFASMSLVDIAILAGVGHLAELPRVVGVGLTPLYMCIGNAIVGILLLGFFDNKRPVDSM